MGYGSSEGVRDAEDECRSEMAAKIARKAAAMVAARDVSSREDAIKIVGDYHVAVANDDLEAQEPSPSKEAKPGQINKIAAELRDLAVEFVEKNFSAA